MNGIANPDTEAFYLRHESRSADGVSKRASVGQPDTVKCEVGLLGDQVEVLVVMEDSESVPVGERGDEQIDGREPVMSGARQLRLRLEGTSLRNLIEVNLGEG